MKDWATVSNVILLLKLLITGSLYGKRYWDDRLDVIWHGSCATYLGRKERAYEKGTCRSAIGTASPLINAPLLPTRKDFIGKIVQKMSHAVADCFQVKTGAIYGRDIYADTGDH